EGCVLLALDPPSPGLASSPPARRRGGAALRPLPGAPPRVRGGPQSSACPPHPGRWRRGGAGARAARAEWDCSGEAAAAGEEGVQPEPRRGVARPGRGCSIEPGERVHVCAAKEGHRARQAARHLLFNRHRVVGRHNRNGCWPDWKLPGLHGGPHSPGDSTGCPRRAIWV
ncbi:hypothetical protein MC885_015956, partial [Smutsia gigantea]